MGNPYNGYTWPQRDAIIPARKRLEKLGDVDRLTYLHSHSTCEICEHGPCTGWHSEDYSLPHIFEPPATYVICEVCHGRLHKRFNQPEEWILYLEHIRQGGYGKEFTILYSKPSRDAWLAQIRDGMRPQLPQVRERLLTGTEWWDGLTLDPESLVAPWARPRPLRPRPTSEEFRNALAQANPTSAEIALMTTHANQFHRTATMRQLASEALDSTSPSTANVRYGTLAHRLNTVLKWEPDVREDGSPIWMTLLAEGWQPESEGREYEWTMVPTLAALYLKE